MKFIKIFLFALFFVPVVSHAASNDFTIAAQLLSAAKNADIQQVQILINNGANVNYVDSTGISIVCTALMNNDVRAAQILQMYGADASNCDRQIKQYNSRNKPRSSGGLFGGLSSAQSITLAAAGAAVVVGGLFLLTDWLNPGNSNSSSSSSSGDRGDGSSSGGSGTNSGTIAFTLPYGPATLTTNYNYTEALDLYSTENTETPIYYNNYDMMTNSYKQNYLLMMHGYSPFARGYLGMQTLRNSSTNAPLNISNNKLSPTDYVMGGMPINVALVTTNGIKAADDTSLQNKFLLWTVLNNDGNGTTGATNANLSSKYYNNIINRGSDDNTLTDDTVSEDPALVSSLDLSGHGTAIGSDEATAYDDLIAKVVGGSDTGFSSADYVGFMPNGQLTIFRTGGGAGLDEDSNNIVIDYYNYRALSLAAGLYTAAQSNPTSFVLAGRSTPTVFANASVIEPLRSKDVEDLDYMITYITTATSTATQQEFSSLIDKYYDLNTTDGTSGTDALPSTDAINFFSKLGTQYYPITVFSTGSTEISASEYTGLLGKTYQATFENAVPLIYGNTEHLFMSVVGVVLDGDGTSGQASVSGYSPVGKYQVSQWQNKNDPDDASDDTYYRARVCGVAGTGTSSVDPWCFAAAGLTDELAVSSAAGAIGVLQSAFSYLNVKQLYTLMALTADGAYLGSSSSGTAYTKDTLKNYLQSMYTLPAEYQFRVDNGEDYLSVFKEVFGYGMINLERATMPSRSVYYYAGTENNPDIVSSASGNSYWRAATNTAIHSSSALPMRAATLTTAAYDVLESIDGTMSLPRIWETSFAIGNSGRHGLYMGDVLSELKTRRDNGVDTTFGDMSFFMTRSERAYNDNMNGLDELRLSFDMGALHIGADYQHHMTDGVSRFSGMANPVLALASNATATNVGYDFGNWTFGSRAFFGTITDDGLLENDPTLSAQYTPATLGLVSGAESSIGWKNDRFAITTSLGFMHETNTLLGSRTDGLLQLGAGDTEFVDAELRYSPAENISLKMRGTYARTNTSANGLYISDVSDIESNAFAIGADIGNFSFAVARPLAAYRGTIKFPYSNYAIVENGNDTYGIEMTNFGVADLNFGSDKRELRLSGEYRHNFGEFTDGAFGFIYRVNPNNTDEYGNESIFMLKMTHRVGI